MTDAGVTWTDERVEALRKLWSDGLSASQIAAQLGGITRNAVIGKVHRLGLSGRGKANGPAAQRPARKTTVRAPGEAIIHSPPVHGNGALAPAHDLAPDPMPDPETRPQEEVVVPMCERVTIMELRETMCRWPLGDPTTAEFRFCGARSITGLPYCTYHARIAYQPAAERKRDRKLLGA